MMADDNNSDADTNQHQDGGSRISSSSPGGAGGDGTGADDPAATEQEADSFNNNIPVFLDRTFRMVENVPDDVVCWSDEGDSFIIKQVLVFEGLLPSYYNHKKFLSFVRQLNFYGFKKVKAGASLRPRSTGSGTAAAEGAEVAPAESESWEEFRHPDFRRGRRDLLVGIKRQKDSGRLKRKKAFDSEKSDALGDLRKDVDALSVDLKTVNSKLDEMMSLLLGMSGGQSRLYQGNSAPPRNAVFLHPQNNTNGVHGAVGAGGGFGFGGGGRSGTPYVAGTATATAVRGVCGGGGGGFGQQWRGGGGGIAQCAQDPYVYGAPIGNYVTPRVTMDHHQQQQQQLQHQQQPQWQGHNISSQQYQQPVHTEQPPVAPIQMRYPVVQPPPLPVAAAHASGSTIAGQSHQQVPPSLRMPPPQPMEASNSNISPAEHKRGDWGKDSSKVRPPNRRGGICGDGGGAGEGSGSSSASAMGEPRKGQQQQQHQLQQPQQQQQQQQANHQQLKWVYTPQTSVNIPLGMEGGGGGVVGNTSSGCD